MPGLQVKDAIAIGQSQSAGRLAIYYNTIQPLHNVFGGFAYWDRSGQLRSDLTVPAISVDSEGLAGSFGGGAVDDVEVHTQVGRRGLDARFAVRRAVHRGDLGSAISRSLQPDGQPKTFFAWIDQEPRL